MNSQELIGFGGYVKALEEEHQAARRLWDRFDQASVLEHRRAMEGVEYVVEAREKREKREWERVEDVGPVGSARIPLDLARNHAY